MSDMLSIDAWYQHVIADKKRGQNIVELLRSEVPARMSVIFERICNLQCNHCIFQAEQSSRKLSQEYDLSDVVPAIAKQLPKETPGGNDPTLIHEGRILTSWHVDVLDSVHQARPDINIFLIDNGYTVKSCERKIDKEDFEFDTIDISVDGPESVHNHQRDDEKAFANALDGLSFAKGVSQEVTSLFTITSINQSSIVDTANILLGGNMVDSWHLTGMSPARPEIADLAASPQEWQTAWEQIREVKQRWPDQVFVHLYNHHDLKMVAKAADTPIKKSIPNGGFGVEYGQAVFTIDGVEVEYSPLSIWPQETILIDADAACRVAYSLAYTLEELRSGINRFGEGCDQYTVKQLTGNDSLKSVYRDCVDQWWNFKGLDYLQEERKLFRDLLS